MILTGDSHKYIELLEETMVSAARALAAPDPEWIIFMQIIILQTVKCNASMCYLMF